MGKRNKSSVTRRHADVRKRETPVSQIFNGLLRSTVRSPGMKPSATIEPFTVLQLDISSEAVASLEDALAKFCAPEAIDGYRSHSKAVGGGEVVARKSVQLDRVPRVLILHLMRFKYTAEGRVRKLAKPVPYPKRLALKKSVAPRQAPARYSLVCTITHRGESMNSGHYTANTRMPDGGWLHFDDDTVRGAAEAEVLDGGAYLLWYVLDAADGLGRVQGL